MLVYVMLNFMKESAKFLKIHFGLILLSLMAVSCSNSDQKTRTSEPEKLPESKQVTIFLVAYGDKVKTGSEPPQSIKFGCGDYLVPAHLVLQGEEVDDLRTALLKLFTVKAHKLGDIDLVNMWTMYGTLVQIDAIYERGYTTTVEISGKIYAGGHCDHPRIMSQLEETVRHYKKDFIIKYNGSEDNWLNLFDMSG